MREIAFAGRTLLADPSGALFVPDERALVVADLHLEKASAFAARGQLLPPYDTAATLARLQRLVARLRPRLVISLGDGFHDGDAPDRLDAGAVAALSALAAGRDLVWVAGNHDPEPPRGLPGTALPQLDLAGLHLRHEPSRAAGLPQIAGHLHPAARVRTRAATVRRRCFATDGEMLVMPAFSDYAGSLDIFSRPFAGLFTRAALMAYCLGGRGIHAFPASALAR
jgi:hypothetical protein